MTKQSLTITGLAILLLGFLLSKTGVPLAEGELESTVITIIKIIGFVSAYVGRVRQGDVNALGMKE